MKTASPIVLLHGWSIDQEKAQKWQAFRTALQKLHFESELLKIPGLSAPLNEVWNLDDYIVWLEKELAGRTNVILLGHSFGGQIAVRYAAQHPDQIAKLILVASSGIRDHSLVPTLKRSVFRVMAKLGKLFFHQEIFRRLLYKLARERDYQNAPPLLRRTMSQILDDEIVAELPQVSCPTLLIWGGQDQVTPLFLGQIFHTQIPQNELHVIPTARHSPHYTHPQEVAQLIQQFLHLSQEPK